LFYSPDDDHWGRSANTDKYYIAQCFYAYSTSILVKAAKVLGKTGDAEFYSRRVDKIKRVFLQQYITPAGLPVSNTQTAYVLALAFDMLPDSMRAMAAERLVENIHRYKDHLTTGFLGTPYICEVLTRFGYLDVAYKLLLQDSYPSWLYPVKMGATTIWERWNGLLPDGTPYPGTMNSFNHYAYGAIGDWLYRTVAGIDTYEDGPGYKHSRIWPHPGGGLSWAEVELETPYGKLSSHWVDSVGRFKLDVEVPANSHSEIYIPAASVEMVKEGGVELNNALGVNIIEAKEGWLHMQVGSGVYHFTVNKESQ
jgi:alpha-L-rhamnosidase